MSERPTPRTDAKTFDPYPRNNNGPGRSYQPEVMYPCDDGSWVDSDHARRLERELDEAREWPAILSGWGGTPEIVHGFIKGQQARIHAAQDVEKERDRLAECLAIMDIRIAEIREENLEQARLLGMSGEREADLRGELEREKRRGEENGVLAHDLGIQLAEAREEIDILRSDEQRLIACSKRFQELLVGVAAEIVTLEQKAEHLKSAKKPWSASAAKTYAMTAQRLRFKLARNRKELKQFFKAVAPEEIVNLKNIPDRPR